ncbi:TetR/AcrR family transcriptional regulator [Arthrobacter castelli]|uniref:SACE_7040 family transcriptional regulator n=1 Tax=Arthrobacter castelli TaxID=271431 RepID=UPI000413C983|nr:TetR family transcriptional regulator [Arthrobacter castelli]
MSVDQTADDSLLTVRGRAKASRRRALLAAAADLFAARGFNGVSIEDLGAAAGVSGPAVYRHFTGKHAVLASLLVGVSQDLYDGGQAVVAAAKDDQAALRGLIEFQVDFALTHADVIRVQDRELETLSDDAGHHVRTLQRQYVEAWVDVLARVQPDTGRELLRMRAHAAFGLINSTPHSNHRGRTTKDVDALRGILEQMAWAALNC